MGSPKTGPGMRRPPRRPAYQCRRRSRQADLSLLRRPHDRHRGLRTRLQRRGMRHKSNDLIRIDSHDSPRHNPAIVHRARCLRPAMASAPRYRQSGVANRRTTYRARRHPPLTRPPLHRRTTRRIGSIQISQLARGTQIPIAPAAPPLRSLQRGFLPWRLSDAGPRTSRRRHSSGRHPKPFTNPDVLLGGRTSASTGCGHVRGGVSSVKLRNSALEPCWAGNVCRLARLSYGLKTGGYLMRTSTLAMSSL